MFFSSATATATLKIPQLATETATPRNALCTPFQSEILVENGGTYSITERFSSRTGEPTQLQNGSRRERGGPHPIRQPNRPGHVTSPLPPEMGAVVSQTCFSQAQRQLQHRKSHNRQLIQPLLQTPYTSLSIQDLLVPRTPCFSVHPTNQADECRHRPVQQLNSTRCC